MNPFLFYLLAERLVNDPASGPAEFRSAISRAYYAAHHTAREFLTQLGIDSPAGPAGHGKIPMALQAITDLGIYQAGKNLDSERAERNKADYSLADSSYNSRATAQASVVRVAQILASLNGCLLDPARRPQAEADVKSWVQNGVGAITGFSII
jgi:hypothetical protein